MAGSVHEATRKGLARANLAALRVCSKDVLGSFVFRTRVRRHSPERQPMFGSTCRSPSLAQL